MIKKILLGFLVLTIALIGFAVFAILIPAGTFKNITPHFDGSSEIIPISIPGPEDIEIDRQDGIVFISVNDRRATTRNPESAKGGILMYKLSEGIQAIKNITPSGIADFHPHGISLFRSNDSTLLLFVVNHRRSSGRHVVERFKWENDTLLHIESIEDKGVMTAPNDIVAVGERSFYVTNDHYYTSGLSHVLEEYLQRAISYVNYFDGNSFRTVAEEIGYANGINQSPDGTYMFVAATTGRAIYVYEKDEQGNLTKIDDLVLGTGPDNIDFDEEGNILVTCHPQLLKYVAHSKDSGKYSPSQVLKIKYNGPKDFTITELFLNDGITYSGSSIAVSYGNTLLIGSVFEPSILYCTLKK